jgi:hypothetical protein
MPPAGPGSLPNLSLVIRQRLAQVALALPLLLVACSSDGSGVTSSASARSTASTGSSVAVETTPETTLPADTTVDSSPATSDSVVGETTTVPVAVVDVKTQPGTATDGFEGAANDISDRRCESSEGTWTVSGTVTNSTAVPANYRIYTSFVDAAGATPGLLEIDVDNVAPGASAEWSGSLAIGLDDLKCVPRVERVAVG